MADLAARLAGVEAAHGALQRRAARWRNERDQLRTEVEGQADEIGDLQCKLAICQQQLAEATGSKTGERGKGAAPACQPALPALPAAALLAAPGWRHPWLHVLNCSVLPCMLPSAGSPGSKMSIDEQQAQQGQQTQQQQQQQDP